MVNDYLHEAMGEDFTAKDFRTWGGTVQAIACLARTPRPEDASERELAAAITAVVREVAAVLRNTPAVCRGSYIHPDVFDAWRDGSLQRLVPAEKAAHPRQLEVATLRLLKRRRRKTGTPRTPRKNIPS
jgi:DNA topoisomerase IB